MDTYTQADRERAITATWAAIGELESEYENTRAALGANGRFYHGHPLLRSLIARIDRLRVEVAKLGK